MPKTGMFARFQRDGQWQSLDIADLSPTEFEQFLDGRDKYHAKNWAVSLHKWIIEHIDFDHSYEVGLMTRVWDKTARLMNLMGFNIDVNLVSYDKPKSPKNESLEDSIRDAAVYFIIWQIYRLGKWGK